MELTEARRRARDMLERIRAGGNPADEARRDRTAPTVKDLADEYLRQCDPYWKPSGRTTVRIYLNSRILPTFGKMPVDRIGPEDVAAWFDAVSRERPGAANRAFEILRAMMFRAKEWGWCERGTNPCLGIAKNPRNNVARFLDADELARIGRVLDEREGEWPETVAAIRLLALTGCRRGEVPTRRSADAAMEQHRPGCDQPRSAPRSVPARRLPVPPSSRKQEPARPRSGSLARDYV